MNKYSVVVSNVGTVYEGESIKAASWEFAECVTASKSAFGRFGNEEVTLFKDGEIEKEFKPCFFFVEFTDTYGVEVNYSWVTRFKVQADTFRHAITKVKREYFRYYNGKVRHDTDDYGDMVRLNFRNMRICAFVEHYDTDRHGELFHVKEI
jgi:hypothetical protein